MLISDGKMCWQYVKSRVLFLKKRVVSGCRLGVFLSHLTAWCRTVQSWWGGRGSPGPHVLCSLSVSCTTCLTAEGGREVARLLWEGQIQRWAEHQPAAILSSGRGTVATQGG